MRKLTTRGLKTPGQKTTPIDFEAIKKRMMLMKFLPGYKQQQGQNWILDDGTWNDTKLWVDTAQWID
jgi:hypothetical protein